MNRSPPPRIAEDRIVGGAAVHEKVNFNLEKQEKQQQQQQEQDIEKQEEMTSTSPSSRSSTSPPNEELVTSHNQANSASVYHAPSTSSVGPQRSYPFLFQTPTNYLFSNGSTEKANATNGYNLGEVNDKLKKLKMKKESKEKRKDKNVAKDLTKGANEEYDMDKVLADLGENSEKKQIKKIKVSSSSSNGVIVNGANDKMKKKKAKKSSSSSISPATTTASSSDDEGGGKTVVEVIKKVEKKPLLNKKVNSEQDLQKKVHSLEQDFQSLQPENNGNSNNPRDLNRQMSKSSENLTFTMVTKKKWKKKSPSIENDSISSSNSSQKQHNYEGRRSANSGYNLRHSRPIDSQNNKFSKESSRSSSVSHQSETSVNNIQQQQPYHPYHHRSTNNNKQQQQQVDLDLSTDFPPLENGISSSVESPTECLQKQEKSISSSSNNNQWPVIRQSDQQAVISKNNNKKSPANPQPDITSSMSGNKSSIPDVAIVEKTKISTDHHQKNPSSNQKSKNPVELSPNPVEILNDQQGNNVGGIEFGFELNENLLDNAQNFDENPSNFNDESVNFDDKHETQGKEQMNYVENSTTFNENRENFVKNPVCFDDEAIVSVGPKDRQNPRFDHASLVALITVIAGRWRITAQEMANKKVGVVRYEG